MLFLLTYWHDNDFPSQVIDLLVVEVILEILINWFQFLIHITLRIVAQVLEVKPNTYSDLLPNYVYTLGTLE